MTWNGSGVYSVPYNWTNDAANGIKIVASRQDGQWSDLVTAMNNVLTRDGQGIATANLPMGGFRHTGVDNGAAVTDYLALGQLKNGSIVYAGTAGGTVDALTGTTSPVATALTNGMQIVLKAAGANTVTAPTFVLDGIGSPLAITKNGGQVLAGGDIFGAGHELYLVYSSTGTRWELINPAGSLGSSTGTGALVRATAPTISGAILSGTITAATVNESGPLTISGDMGAAGAFSLQNTNASDGRSVINFVNNLSTSKNYTLGINPDGGTNKAFALRDVTAGTTPLSVSSAGVLNLTNTPTINGTPISTGGARTTSTDQTITDAATFTFTHSLGKLPDSVMYFLVCQSNDSNYTAGQIIQIVPGSSNDSNSNQGFSSIVGTSTIIVRYGSGNSGKAFSYNDATTGATGSLTNANWKMRVIASIVS